MPEFHAWSDASGSKGIGGHLEGAADEFSERIPEKHQGKDIIFKEALAVLRCADLWCTRMARRLVIFHVDNQALVAALDRGSCRHRPTQALIRRLYTLATWNSFSFRAVWLSSEENARADKLSRFMMHDPGVAFDLDTDDPHFDPDLSSPDLLSINNVISSAYPYDRDDTPFLA